MATQTLEELLVLINASTEKLRTEMGKGNRSIGKFRKDVDKNLAGIEKRFTKLTGSIKGQLSALVGGLGLGLLIREAAQSASALEEVGRQADSLGASVESIQELTLTFREFGLDANDVSDALGTLADRAQDAQDGMQSFIDDFKLLGVEVDDLRGKRPEDLFRIVAERVAEIEDPTRRTAGIVRIFGDDLGRRLNPLLIDGVDALDKYADRWRELGAVVDEEGVRAAGEAAEKFRELQLTLGARFTQVVADNADLIERLAEVLISAAENAGIFARGLDRILNISAKAQIEDLMREIALLNQQLQNPNFIGPERDLVADRLFARQKELERLRKATSGGGGEVTPGEQEAATAGEEAGRAFTAGFFETLDIGGRLTSDRLIPELTADQIFPVSDIVDAGLELDSMLADQTKGASDAKDAVSDLGLTFESAFENAIVEGEKLSDVLRALLKDIIRIAARNLFINPLASIVTASLPGLASGGPFHRGQPFMAGERGTEMIVPDVSGRVLTAAQTQRMMRGGGAGGDVNIYQSFDVAIPSQLQAYIQNVGGTAGRDAAVQVLRAREGRV